MPTVWLTPLAAVLGLAIGSFMTVVAERVPTGASVVRPRSRCPKCDAPIRNRDNIPVLSWLLLRGRCRDCGARIAVRYPLLGLMPVITVIDLERRIIPNKLMYPALVVAPVYLVIARLGGAPLDLVRAAIGFAAFGGVLFVVAAVSRGMGMGDVKLAALIGLVLGALSLGQVAVAAGAAVVLGALGAVVALARGAGRKGAIPFGPFLAAGAVVGALWGPSIAAWYQRTMLHV